MENCKQCKHRHSDSCGESVWYICTHDIIMGIWGIEGRLLEDDNLIPEWCPLITFCETCGQQTKGDNICNQDVN